MEVGTHCPLDEEFRYKGRRELAMCLDPIAPMGNDWRLLMDEMGFSYNFKHYLESEKSPTMALLEAWTRMEGSRATIMLLREYISKLDPPRIDAVDIVQKHIKLQIEKKAARKASVDSNDDLFNSIGGSFTTLAINSQIQNHSSVSSAASLASSLSSNPDENSLPRTLNSPVNHFTLPSMISNGSSVTTTSELSNSTYQEPSSYVYPSSSPSSLAQIPNSYSTDPMSFRTSDTLLHDRQFMHTSPAHSIANGETLLLTGVENGFEPLGIQTSGSPMLSSARGSDSMNTSPRLSPHSPQSRSPRTRSPRNSSSPVNFRRFHPVEEESLIRRDSSEDDSTVPFGEDEIQNYDIYLSASQDREDQEFAEDMYQKLQKENFTVFFSGHHSMIGRPFSENVVRMIREKCTKTLIILSDSYNKSESCTYEARMAHMKSLDARNHVLVPVMYKKCKTPDFISHLFYLDFERYKDRPSEDIQEYFWNRLYRSLRYNPNIEKKTNPTKKDISSSNKKLTKTVLSHRPKFPFFTR